MINRKIKIKYHKGFTLLELVIALGISSLAVLGLGTMVSQSMKSSNNIFSNLDQESIRNRVRTKIDCQNTINQVTSNGKNSVLYGKNNNEIFNSRDKAGRTLMDAGNFDLWVEDHDVNTGELNIILINKKTQEESVLFKNVSYFCPV